MGYIGMVVAKMKEEYGTLPSDLKVFIAPAIHKQSYAFPLGDEHIAQRDKPNWQPYLSETEGKIHIDVVAYNIDQLKDAGVKAENIEDSGIDTYSPVDFFSHRQSVVENLPEGRFATLAWLK
jgi:copper oxidase (laccase) domain-containing protein